MPDSLKASRHVGAPSTRAIVPTGEAFIANGLDAPQRHDGLASSTENAGIPEVVNATMAATASGSGALTGNYSFAVRNLDDESIPGSLGSAVTFGASSDALYEYHRIPIPTDSRVTKREIYRNTSGQEDVFYLDKTVDDITTTYVTSSRTDTALATQTALPILTPDRLPNARRYGVPPNYMSVVHHHGDRTFWCVPRTYGEGHALCTGGTANVQTVGANLTAEMLGRRFTVEGASTAYTIDNLGGSPLTIVVLNKSWSGAHTPFARYSISPPKSERNNNYFSFPGEPESVYSGDGVIAQTEGDGETQTGAFSFGSFYFLTFEHKLRRWSYTTDPARGAIWQAANRGMLNYRCYAQVENFVYILDRAGIYRFNGSVDEIDQPIQDYFRDNVVWENSQWWHAAAFPEEQSVKFFITLDGSMYPRHALVYNYRTGRWWEEEFHREIGDSALVPAPISRKLLLGSEQNSVFVQDSQSDGPSSQFTGQYAVSSATVASVTVTAADWTDSDMIGAPIVVTSGRGKKQRRTILSATESSGKITIDQPWTVKPDSTSTIQIGGIHYSVATKHFTNDRENNSRNVRVTVDPTSNPATADIRMYENRRSVATTASVTDSNSQNVQLTRDDANIEFNMLEARTGGDWDGLTEIPLPVTTPSRGAGNRYVQIEVDGDTNQERVVIREIEIEGVE